MKSRFLTPDALQGMCHQIIDESGWKPWPLDESMDPANIFMRLLGDMSSFLE
jgi:hypothetical protein